MTPNKSRQKEPKHRLVVIVALTLVVDFCIIGLISGWHERTQKRERAQHDANYLLLEKELRELKQEVLFIENAYKKNEISSASTTPPASSSESF